MSEETSLKSTVFYSLLPPFILLTIDLFALYLQPQSFAVSHLSLALLSAQLLCLFLFLKGEMCPGQRARLINLNKGFLLFWLTWLFLSAFSTYHYYLTDLVSLCGIGATLAICLQPKKIRQRRPFIFIGMALASLGFAVYALMFLDMPLIFLPMFNPLTQILTGIILANLTLLGAKNRLHNFMAILPMSMLITLFLNALFVLGLLFYAHLQRVVFPWHLPWILYFGLHLLLLVIIGGALFMQKRLDYLLLFILLIISASLPLWATFAYLHP